MTELETLLKAAVKDAVGGAIAAEVQEIADHVGFLAGEVSR